VAICNPKPNTKSAN